jgi:hypothetical protein
MYPRWMSLLISFTRSLSPTSAPCCPCANNPFRNESVSQSLLQLSNLGKAALRFGFCRTSEMSPYLEQLRLQPDRATGDRRNYRHQVSAMGRSLIKLEWHPGSQRPRASHRQEPHHRSGPSGDQWLGADRAGRGRSPSAELRRLVISCRGTSPHYKWDDSDPVSIRLSLLMLNDIALAGVSGEVMTMINEHLKKQTPSIHTIMVTHKWIERIHSR